MNLAILTRGTARRAAEADERSILDDIAEGEALLRQSEALDRPEWPTWQAVVTAGDVLFDALTTWRAIECGDLHWETAYPHLFAEAGEAAGYELALQMAGEEAEAARVALGLAMSAHCGMGKAKATSTGSAA